MWLWIEKRSKNRISDLLSEFRTDKTQSEGIPSKEQGCGRHGQRILRELSSAPEDVEYQKPIPNDVEITKYRIEGDQLSVWMDSDYYNMDAATEVFCRAAVVRTMTQIPDISCVSFLWETVL